MISNTSLLAVFIKFILTCIVFLALLSVPKISLSVYWKEKNAIQIHIWLKCTFIEWKLAWKYKWGAAKMFRFLRRTFSRRNRRPPAPFQPVKRSSQVLVSNNDGLIRFLCLAKDANFSFISFCMHFWSKKKHIPAPKNVRETITCHVVLLDGSDITVGELPFQDIAPIWF